MSRSAALRATRPFLAVAVLPQPDRRWESSPGEWTRAQRPQLRDACRVSPPVETTWQVPQNL